MQATAGCCVFGNPDGATDVYLSRSGPPSVCNPSSPIFCAFGIRLSAPLADDRLPLSSVSTRTAFPDGQFCLRHFSPLSSCAARSSAARLGSISCCPALAHRFCLSSSRLVEDIACRLPVMHRTTSMFIHPQNVRPSVLGFIQCPTTRLTRLRCTAPGPEASTLTIP